ncbi:hypothetical protein CY34DRAFT_10639 [Suillus luteus UH-Slu-Lm8-n1]|uniref:Uncharacterized protein n=1 Tax=Suillus luteus UH-Slu-Lm8-n1 TaxID=930992 RepID=A0A0D0A4P5_9AGAM|nr:hypothetical protein CY34DRAFT_10639 [Suillus luteus UH-Slu-Lm8-n1]
MFINTIGIDFKMHTIELDGKCIKLQIDSDAVNQPQAATSSYHDFPASVPPASHTCYQQPNSLAVYDGLFETGPPPNGQHNAGISELAMRYMPSQSNLLSSMSIPVLPAPVPRQAYLGSSIISDYERTCQEQKQQRQALRVQTQRLQNQRTATCRGITCDWVHGSMGT